MSMTLGCVIGDAAFAASDRRHFNVTQGRLEDRGDKLVRCDGGWATASGSWGIAERGLRALAENDTGAFVRLAGEAAVRDRDRLQGHTAFTCVGDEGTLKLFELGLEHGVHEPDGYAFTWPSGLTAAQQDAATRQFLDVAQDATSLTDFIRAIACAFAFVSRQPAVKTVSREIEIGMTFQGRARYLRADSVRLLLMSEQDVVRLLRDPPSRAALRAN